MKTLLPLKEIQLINQEVDRSVYTEHAASDHLVRSMKCCNRGPAKFPVLPGGQPLIPKIPGESTHLPAWTSQKWGNYHHHPIFMQSIHYEINEETDCGYSTGLI